MTTAVLEQQSTPPARTTPAPVPLTRLFAVELRKSFDTRSGFWLLASIAITAALATGAVIAFAPDSAIDYETFATAIGFPMAVVLPVIAILSVTSEWSQRSGLTTFTLVPHRGRVIGAKLAVTLAVGVASMLLAAAIGAVGNVVGSALAGVDTTWNVGPGELGTIVVANVLGMLVGFMLGVLIRNSAGAVVGYFVYGFVLPPLSMLLATSQEWFAKVQPWVDFNDAQAALFEDHVSAVEWAQVGVTGVFWLAIPLAVGLWAVLRSEVT
jgi:hypothetical protein